MAQHGSVQGVMQVSVLGQFPAGLLDQVLRRLASHAEHQYALQLEEDVFSRGPFCSSLILVSMCRVLILLLLPFAVQACTRLLLPCVKMTFFGYDILGRMTAKNGKCPFCDLTELFC